MAVCSVATFRFIYATMLIKANKELNTGKSECEKSVVQTGIQPSVTE
jgi:hypothetical protein